MVMIDDIIDTWELKTLIEEGMVTAREHNTEPLVILNYTPACQFARNWNRTTTMCRGLIYNTETREVLARPFPKFFNWDEQGSVFPPAGPAIRMEKMDGSLGILYTPEWDSYGEGYGEQIATRGSFHSEQAEWATGFYWETVMAQTDKTYDVFTPVKDKTYLFEIIYPENRIVVDYGGESRLVLLDVIDNETGHSDMQEFDDCFWPDKVKRYNIPGFDSGQCADIPDGDEGYVYLWPVRNFRTKMKSPEYIRIHRIVTGLSAKSIWEMLVQGKTIDQIKIDVPEEFHEFVDTEAGKIIDQAMETLQRVNLKYDTLLRKSLDPWSRKEFALAIKDDPDKKYLFLALDNKPIYPVALKEAKPSSKALVSEE